MHPVAAFLIVLGAYTATMLAWRRLVIWRSRTGGPELALLAGFDHAALARELAEELRPPAGGGSPEERTAAPAPELPPLAGLPAAWHSCTFAVDAAFAPARERIEAGQPAAAAELARDRDALRGLLTWGCLSRLFAGDAGVALACALALREADAVLGARLSAQVLARRAELLPQGTERVKLCEEALEDCRRAGAGARMAPPGLAGLAAHLETLGISVWTLEIAAFRVRRRLDRIERRAPHAPFVHLTRAHLAALLGDGESAMEHLARALYHARGEAFYARVIGGSSYVERVRPSLSARARSLQRGGSPE